MVMMTKTEYFELFEELFEVQMCIFGIIDARTILADDNLMKLFENALSANLGYPCSENEFYLEWKREMLAAIA